MQNKPTKDEFCARFKARMLAHAQTFSDNSSVADYAEEVAPTYFDEQHQQGKSPEDCADADVSYWED